MIGPFRNIPPCLVDECLPLKVYLLYLNVPYLGLCALRCCMLENSHVLFLTHFSSLPPLPQEYADALNELTPEQAEEHRRSVEKALAAARELEVVKQKLDEQRLENEEKLRQENEGLLTLCVFFNSTFFYRSRCQ